jgi:hypothetical protein
MSFNYSLMEPEGGNAGNAIDIGGGGFGGGWGGEQPEQQSTQISRQRFESLSNVDDLLDDEEAALAAGLARDAAAVKECFKDLAGLVQEQGGLLDAVDQGVGTAAVHAGKGTALVVQAREHQKRVRVVVRARTSYVMMMLLLPAFPLLPPASLSRTPISAGCG